MAGEFSLDESFWRRFTTTYWNRRPTVLRSPFGQPLVTPSELFRSAVAATARLRQPTDDFVLASGGRRVVMQRDLSRLVPRAADASLRGYLRRLRDAGARRQVAIFVNHFQVELGWRIFTRFRQFLNGLYQLAGIPAWRAEVGLFMGNYRRTAVGVHRDSGDVFCLVVEGTKRIRAWRAGAISSLAPLAGPYPYADLLGRSMLLEGRPGDIIYWPSSYWHIAESEGRPGSSLSLALYYDGSLRRALGDTLEANASVFANDRRIDALGFAGNGLPRQLFSAVRHVERKAPLLTLALLRFWMERITGLGFARLPRPSGRARLRMGGSVRAVSDSPILWHQFHGHLVLAAGGRSIVLRYHPELVRLMRRVGRGRVCLVGRLLRARKPRGVTSAAARRALQFLLNARAIEYL